MIKWRFDKIPFGTYALDDITYQEYMDILFSKQRYEEYQNYHPEFMSGHFSYLETLEEGFEEVD